MPEFTLQRQRAKVTHVNVREEKHGDDPVVACDVKVTADVPNTFLDQLSPTLRSSLYQGEGEGASAQPPLLADATHLPVLRYPFLGVVPFSGVEMVAGVVFHGKRKADAISFSAEVNAVKVACKEGGTVELTFRVQALPEPEEIGRLSALLGHEVDISVTPVGQVEEGRRGAGDDDGGDGAGGEAGE